MKVLKFGGSSVGTPQRIRGLIEILKDYYTRGEKFTVVFSAFGGVTDSLIRMSTLAADGDKSYLEEFQQFRERHLQAIEELISPENREQALPHLQENLDVLKNLPTASQFDLFNCSNSSSH